MATEGYKRKISAILSADVVGLAKQAPILTACILTVVSVACIGTKSHQGTIERKEAMVEKVLGNVVADFRSLKASKANRRDPSGQLRSRERPDDPWHTYEYPWHHTVAMLMLMRAAGWSEMDYGTLLVESGQGLSFGYKRNEGMHIYSLIGGAFERIEKATGFQLEWTDIDDLDQAWAWVKDSIDRGMPVASEYGEWHIVAGYREGNAIEDRQWYVLANEPISPWDGAWLTWEQMKKLLAGNPHSKYRCRYGRKVEEQPPYETVRNVVRWIVEWSEHHPGMDHRGMPWADSAFGLAAIEAYAGDIGDMSLTVENDFQWGNNCCHSITPQWNSRRYVAAYLEQKAELLGPAQESVKAAAAHYREADAAWAIFDEQLGQRYVNRDEGDQSVGWAEEGRRRRGAAAIYRALEHEKAAINSLSAALKVIER